MREPRNYIVGLLMLTVEDTANVSTPFNASASADAIPGAAVENRFTTPQSLSWMYNGATPEIKIEIPA